MTTNYGIKNAVLLTSEAALTGINARTDLCAPLGVARVLGLGVSRFRLEPGADAFALLCAIHYFLEGQEGIVTRVIVLSVEDALDRPPIDIDLFGQRVELSFVTQLAQPCTQALEIIHGVAVDARSVVDGVILDIYASRCKANMTRLTR